MFKNPLYVYGGDDVRIPAHVNVAKELIAKMLTHKDDIALVNASTGASVTYGQVVRRTIRVTCWLAECGVKRGSVVGVCSENRFEVIAAVLGIMCVGAAFTPINMGSARIKHRITTAKPEIIFFSPQALSEYRRDLDESECTALRVLFSQPPFADPLDEPSDEQLERFEPVSVRGWEDTCVILHSSGTTGLPKAVPVTHLSLILTLSNAIDLRYNKGKRVLSTREWYYSYGLFHVLACLKAGSTVVYCEGQSEMEFLRAIQDYKIAIVQATQYNMAQLVKSTLLPQFDLSSVQYVVASSTPLNAELVDEIKRRLQNVRHVIQMYGLSEAGVACGELFGRRGIKSGSVGPPCPTFVVKVVDVHTKEVLGPHQRGEIRFKSPAVISGYVGSSNTDVFDEEGFFRTGDVGYYDEDQYFYIVDRIKELIKCNSSTVAPAELEAILLKHPGVSDAGVVGSPHSLHGEVPAAFVVLQPGASATAQEIAEFVNKQVPSFMQLTGGIVFLPALPRNNAKLDRKSLKLKLKL